MVWSILAIMLVGSFGVILMVSQIAYKLENKYPYVDCESLNGYDQPLDFLLH